MWLRRVSFMNKKVVLYLFDVVMKLSDSSRRGKLLANCCSIKETNLNYVSSSSNEGEVLSHTWRRASVGAGRDAPVAAGFAAEVSEVNN